jgi:hypothetical protein
LKTNKESLETAVARGLGVLPKELANFVLSQHHESTRHETSILASVAQSTTYTCVDTHWPDSRALYAAMNCRLKAMYQRRSLPVGDAIPMVTLICRGVFVRPAADDDQTLQEIPQRGAPREAIDHLVRVRREHERPRRFGPCSSGRKWRRLSLPLFPRSNRQGRV